MTKYSTIIGMDLGDKHHYYCELDAASGEIFNQGRVGCTEATLTHKFAEMKPVRIAIETGTHSPWVSRLLAGFGHEVLVANARKLRAIYTNIKKSDRIDAETIARIARVDPQLLSPIQHRGEQAQADLAVVRARDIAVATRTKLINHVRGAVKSFGHRLPSASAPYFHKKVLSEIPNELRPALAPLLSQIETLTQTINDYDDTIKKYCAERYPETETLRTIPGVGPITALSYVLTLEDPSRFAKSRAVPAYFGLVPARSQSGDADPQLRITKAGDGTMRRLLVSCAQHILRESSPDSQLRQWGLKLAADGGKRAKRRAVVAVARKLAVILHRLWSDGTCYEPFPQSRDNKETEAVA